MIDPVYGETAPDVTDILADATLTAREQAVALLVPIDATPSLVAPDAPGLPAALLDRYQNVTLLGRGGMGVVYRAHDRQLGRDVALKLLVDDNDDGGQSLLREARSQARLDHPHACKVYEVGVTEGKAYLVMQLIDGLPFDQVQSQMMLEERVTVVRQVALALHQAHRFGLVHRDVKPSNILVERGEDGSWKPYLMDFGIAREIGAQGPTLTGAIAGTPAFMAPEQARGEVRSLDRRTDVYSLGATLFDVLTGRPPFRAASPWELMRLIMTEDAPSIRTIQRDLPADLEAIVTCCLEKEPYRRYDSAKALGDDLQRFLDGDPVHARRLSLAYRLFRKARRHRLVVALASVAVVAALIVASLGVRARRAATEQASLARELGEDVKEMELFLRTAYELPLHDIEREKDVVRSQLHTIEARMLAAGRAGDGPGHYALGRGHLALQEPEEARAHLEKASAAGYASPDLDYALGLALGELAEKARESAKRIDNAAKQEARAAAIKAELEEPALRHLRASLGARLETASYVEGLLLLYEGKPEEALVKAQEAFAKMPWLYEARKLEGDARFAIGSRFKHDKAFDYDRMSVEFQAAAESYQRAAEIARSDSRVHVAECELWTQIMNAATQRTESLIPSFEKAKAACGRAIAASSRSEEGRLKLAFLHVAYGWWCVQGTGPEDPMGILEEAVSRAKEGAQRSPREPMAMYILALSWRSEVEYLSYRGLDNSSQIDHTIASYLEVIRLDPTFLWAISEIGGVYAMQGTNEAEHGRAPEASFDLAMEYGERAVALDPTSLTSISTLTVTYSTIADHLADAGQDLGPILARLRKNIAAGEALSHEWPWGDYYLAHAEWLIAERDLAEGRDPTAAIDVGVSIAVEQVKRGPASQDSYDPLARLWATKARYLLGRGEDPESALRTARESLQRTAEGQPSHLDLRVWRARIESIALQWAVKKHRVTTASFQAARAPLLPLLAQPRVEPSLYIELAGLHRIEAAWLLETSRPAEQAITDGLAMAEKALALNPHLARALLAKGSLLLLRARAARAPEIQREAALAAEQALSAAEKENPLLGREIAPLLLSLKKAPRT